MAKIYTKTGDQGETGLFGGERVKKDHPRIVAYGSVDELNAVLGLVRAVLKKGELDPILEKIQNDLFLIGSHLATPRPEKLASRGAMELSPEVITFLEQSIDHLEESLPPLREFILPGGTESASRLHLARTVCRRAERETISLAKSEEVESFIIIYLNRLSDLLFVMARWANRQEGGGETVWKKI